MDIPAEVSLRIKTFLKERRESNGGGWAPVTDEDMEQFHEVIYALIEAKWGADADGDRPMEYKLIDRTRYKSLHYFPIPYGHKDGKREEEFDNAITNLSMAMESVRTTEVVFERRDRSARIPVKEPQDELVAGVAHQILSGLIEGAIPAIPLPGNCEPESMGPALEWLQGQIKLAMEERP